MNESAQRLRKIPKMDLLLQQEEIQKLFDEHAESLVTASLRKAVEEVRNAILAGEALEPDIPCIVERCNTLLMEAELPHQRLVINATGVLLHTNLGRALLAPAAAKALYDAALSYTTLEFDCSRGSRGDRYLHVEGILKELLGVESALVVNNNAAAVLLMLSSLAKDREVIVSRGELVEIGGSFRVPEVMEQSGCHLKEVGATNKTHPRDYRRAITENTAALLKVHTSNYRVIGFTEDVSLSELSEIAREADLPLLYDLGSGSMLPLRDFGLRDEPTARESLLEGVDVICFSGDKLLGGPQAGIIAGRKVYLDKMKKHPLLRALRVDKLTLAALEATLRLYRDADTAKAQIPLYRMLNAPLSQVKARAERLMGLLKDLPKSELAVIDTLGQVGGGSAPGETFPSAALSIRSFGLRVDQLHKKLLCAPMPIVGRIHDDQLILDMRTVEETMLPRIAETILSIAQEEVHA